MENISDTSYRCDQCGRSIDKIHRRYHDEIYCTTCYYREFKSGICPSCGNKSRLYRKNKQSICRNCENDGKPCIRCGKMDFVIGKITDNGPACNSCAVHYREIKSCTYCGEPSKYLSRDKNAGFDEPACPKCRQKNFETCSICRRYRQIELTSNGCKVCKKCLEMGEIPCPVCNEPMPAGYGNQCETCSLKQRRDKAIQANCEKFSNGEMSLLYCEFCAWLENRSGLRKTVSTLNRYIKFFVQFELITQEPISYQVLLAAYGADGLRSWMHPVHFLSERYALSVCENAKKEDSERRQISKLLNSVPLGTQGKKLLDEYYEYLLTRIKSKETKINSARLALRPVVDLINTIGHEAIPTQRDLDIYLKKKPGQRAAISGFVGFLKNKYKINWTLPKQVCKSKIYARREAELNLVKLLRNPVPTKTYQQKLLRAQLLYFHGVTVKASIGELEVKENDKNFKYVDLDGKQYWLPRDLWISLVVN